MGPISNDGLHGSCQADLAARPLQAHPQQSVCVPSPSCRQVISRDVGCSMPVGLSAQEHLLVLNASSDFKRVFHELRSSTPK